MNMKEENMNIGLKCSSNSGLLKVNIEKNNVEIELGRITENMTARKSKIDRNGHSYSDFWCQLIG